MGGEALEKIGAVYERLEAGNPEAVSHALTSCRRLIAAVADAVYPPSKDPIDVDGKTVDVNRQQSLNRIETFVSTNTRSKSRRKRLRRTLENLYNRTSAGVHADVSVEEAKSIFLHTYVVLGEIVLLDQVTDGTIAGTTLTP